MTAQAVNTLNPDLTPATGDKTGPHRDPGYTCSKHGCGTQALSSQRQAQAQQVKMAPAISPAAPAVLAVTTALQRPGLQRPASGPLNSLLGQAPRWDGHQVLTPTS